MGSLDSRSAQTIGRTTMIRTEAKEFDLSEPEAVWIREHEDAVLFIDFEKDMTGATHKIILREYRWPYAQTEFSTYDDTERTVFDTSDEANGVIKHTISLADIADLGNRRLDLQWQVVLGGRTWIACDRSIYIGEGD